MNFSIIFTRQQSQREVLGVVIMEIPLRFDCARNKFFSELAKNILELYSGL